MGPRVGYAPQRGEKNGGGSRQSQRVLESGPIPVRVLSSRYDVMESRKRSLTAGRIVGRTFEGNVGGKSEAIAIRETKPRSTCSVDYEFCQHLHDGFRQCSTPPTVSNDKRDSSSSLEFSCFTPSTTPPTNSERWAGPGYSNSPPPSTLPFPKFPVHRIRSVTVVPTEASRLLEGEPTRNLSSSPARVSYGFFPTTSKPSPFVDPISASKDLRRLLNLNIVQNVDDDIDKNMKLMATEGLNKILQLS